MGSRDEQRIVDGLRGGDIASWHAFYDAFAESVWRVVAVRLGPRKADIADVVQETFLKALAGIHGFDPSRGRLESWLMGIARYQAREWLRREASHNRLSDEHPAVTVAEVIRRITENQQARVPEPEQLLEQAETVVLVQEVLARLTPDHAYVLIAKYVDALSADEMAAEMEISADAVRARLTRARRAFRRLFAEQTEEVRQPPAGDSE